MRISSRILFFSLVLCCIGQVWAQDAIERMYFSIDTVLDRDGDFLLVAISAGKANGLKAGSVGEVRGRWTQSAPYRSSKMGVARIHRVRFSSSEAEVELLSPEKEIHSGDLVELPVLLPEGARGGLVFTLVKNNIFLLDEKKQGYYSWKKIVSGDDFAGEDEIISDMLSDIHRAGEHQGSPKIRSGKFQGMSLSEAMLASTTDDVAQFLKIFLVRPDRYRGRECKLIPTYSSWLMDKERAN